MLLAALLTVAVGETPIPPAVMATRPTLPMAVVTGFMDERFSERLDALLASNPQVTYVQIESLGGRSAQAYKAAEVLNQRGIELRVLGRCASACALLWAGTRNRTLVEGARIGLHASAVLKEPPLLVRGVVRRHNVQRKTHVLEQAGFPPATISRALSTPHNSMLWLTSSELGSLGVRFRLVPRGYGKPGRSAPNNSSKPTPLRGAA